VRRLDCEKRSDVLSADIEFPYRVALGETIEVETADCFGGYPGRPDVPGLGANPVTGPLYVEGVEAGDTLAVRVENIETVGNGFIGSSDAKIEIEVDHERQVAVYAPGMELPLSPMLGTLGVAPSGEPVPTMNAGDHGGNMDCNIVRAGTTICFAVNAPGAGLGMGDMHAVMGDGEVSGQGLEAGALVTIRAAKVRGLGLGLPYGIHGDRFFIVGWGDDMHQAADRAQAEMVAFLMATAGLDEDLARRFLGLGVDLRTGWRGGETPTVWLELRLAYLPAASREEVNQAVMAPI